MNAERVGSTKFTLIQAMRGIASTWVVLFHIERGQNISALTALWPDWVTNALFRYGGAGVGIFFVLSGFVITHSLAGKQMTGREFARFVARRSVRLDPPYWASIVLAVSVGTLFALLRHQPIPLPDGTTVLLHLLYLQELLGRPEIEIVYWTLTYEIQFYLVLAAAWWLASHLIRSGTAAERARAIVLVPLAILALASALLSRDWAPHGLFVNLWYGFFAGVLAYEAGYRRRSPILLLLLCGIMIMMAQFREGEFNTPCAATALILFFASRTGWLENALSARPWQFLGNISYSLYLVHVPTLLLVFAVWRTIAGRGPMQDFAGLMVACAAVLIAAYLFWWLIERPSHMLASRLWRRRRSAPIPAGQS